MESDRHARRASNGNSEDIHVGFLLRRPAVEARVGLSRAWIYSAMEKGEFPRPVKIGRRAVAWPTSVIDRWIAERMAQSGLDAG